MKLSTKVALWSGLVLPGIGHIIVRRYKTGVGLIVGAISIVTFLSVHVFSRSMKIVDQVLQGEISGDIEVIRAKVLEQQIGEEAQLFQMLSWLFLVLWAVGIIDSYRRARIIERDGSE